MWWRLGAGSRAAPEARPRRVNSTPAQPHPPPAQDLPLAEWLLLGCGVVAAMHVGKLPPALPVLRQQLGVSLVEAGFLLSTVQLGSMLLGLALGLGAHRFGLRRSLLGGLWLLVLASLAGTQATSAQGLLAARAAEGVGVLLVALSAPSLLRRIVPAHRQSLRLGLWGTYMPTGTGLALLLGPLAIATLGWAGWWAGLALLSAAMAVAAAVVLPPDSKAESARPQGGSGPVSPTGSPTVSPSASTFTATLSRSGPWLLALSFGAYSAQWLTVIGFLPTVYAEAGVAPGTAGLLTAVAALANAGGNVAGGRALHRSVPARVLLMCGFAAMAGGAFVAFALQDAVSFSVRYAAVLVFSGVGGLVPATLFALAGQVAADPRAMPVVVGLLTQGTGAGQFLGPPAAAWWAAGHGGWSQTWVATGIAALAGGLLAWVLCQRLDSPAAQAKRAGP
jgi:MFS family permease